MSSERRPQLLRLLADNPAWLNEEMFWIGRKFRLTVVSQDSAPTNQVLTFCVKSAWDDLMKPPVTWVARDARDLHPETGSPFIAKYFEQQMCAYPGNETYFDFRGLPRRKVELIQGIRIVDIGSGPGSFR
jgi:hypothetical protein